MKRILVPFDKMFSALVSLNVSCEQAAEIMQMFEVIDAGYFDALVMPDLSFNVDNKLSKESVILTLFAFWQCVVSNSDVGSEHEQQALGAIRTLYFFASNCGYLNISSCVSAWWQHTNEIHGSAAVELWS